MPDPVSSEVIELVRTLLDAGCDMWSIGSGYSIGEPRHEPEAARVEAILAAFGPRLQLKAEISRHLKEIGRELSI